MPSAVLFGISVAFGLAVWGIVARQYIWPALSERPSPENLKPILLLHAFRFLGLAFVVPGVVSPELPAAFAQPVAYGDFITAVLALLAVATLGTGTGSVVTWVFNTFGTADLLFAFYLGSRISLPNNPGLLGAGYFILAAYVPLLLVTHGLAFRILLRTKVVAPSRSQTKCRMMARWTVRSRPRQTPQPPVPRGNQARGPRGLPELFAKIGQTCPNVARVSQ
jgi:hypothetical protein